MCKLLKIQTIFLFINLPLTYIYISQMLNPTFASFKNAKQAAFNNTVLCQTNTNIQVQPKSFNDLKINNNNSNSYIQFHHHQHKQDKNNINNVNNSNNNNKKVPISFHLKKSNSQLSMLQPQNAVKCNQAKLTKPKINAKNYVTAKKNIAPLQRLSSKDKSISRPSINGPSLLKNKSFVQGINSQCKQNAHFTSRPSCESSSRSYKFSDVSSIDSFERKSQDNSINGINISGSSNGEKDSFSYFNSSKFQDSISMNLKDSFNSNKLGDKTINFSRKTHKKYYNGNLIAGKKNQHDTTYFGEVSSLCQMARQMQSSFGSDVQSPTNSNKNLTQSNNTILLSKKLLPSSKYKNNYEPRKITIKQFELLQEMGQGKYGKVYMAKHKYTNFICALKAVSKQKIKQQNIQQAFIRQIKIQMYLNHPNIVKLYGFFDDQQNIYLIMECCLSGHLLKRIKQTKIFQQNQILQIISNVFQAVSFLHCHGIIHRDLKPENIVIQNEVYKICDFGWAAYAKGDTRTTFCGTPLYVCPEVLKGNQYDQKADVWGLGVLTYQLAYGRVPFPIWSQTDMLKIVKDPVYFPSWTSVSQKMQNLIKSMLHKDPAKRLSLNQIMSSPLISQYVGMRLGIKSQIDVLF